MADKDHKALDYASHRNEAWHKVLRAFFWLLFHTLWPLKVRGREHVPRKGAALIVCNHLSLVDPLVVGFAAGRIVCYMAKVELFRTPIVGFLIRQVGAFPVDRAKPDANTMRTALTVLKDGELLGMFPEGTRSTSGDLLAFRAGALRIAARARTQIIPAAVHNTHKALPPRKWVRPARIGITFGPPIDISELFDRNDRGEALDRALENLRDRIHELQGR
jgi:1-acyl-sn-glycerol-3-phosphate acyltransferase